MRVFPCCPGAPEPSGCGIGRSRQGWENIQIGVDSKSELIISPTVSTVYLRYFSGFEVKIDVGYLCVR